MDKSYKTNEIQNIINNYYDKFVDFVLCNYNDKLSLVPVDDEISGYYGDYSRVEYIDENSPLNELSCYLGKIYDGLKVEGILFTKDYESKEQSLVTDSWDGFQPIQDIVIMAEDEDINVKQFNKFY